MKIFDPLFDRVQHLGIYPVFHIADSNVCMRTFTSVHDLDCKFGITDPSPDQSSIEDQGFYKTITRTSEYFVFIRFRYTSGGISTAVKSQAGIVSINKNTGNAGQELDDHF